MNDLFAYVLGIFLGALLSWMITRAYFVKNNPQPISTFECPCEVDAIVTDVIKHTNKEGLTTVTTYVDVSKCVGLK